MEMSRERRRIISEVRDQLNPLEGRISALEKTTKVACPVKRLVSENELLPCIHCGSPMEYSIRDGSFKEPNGKWFTGWECGVACTHDYCGILISYFWAGGGCDVTRIEHDLCKKWNKRFSR